MDKTRWIIFTVVTVGILTSLVIFSSSSKIKVDTIDTNTIQIASSQNGNIADHVFGKKDSKVILIEYGDYQCPPCGSMHPSIKSISEQYKDKILFIFRNFPIPSLHPNARAAAATVEAAGLQGKYWEMHNNVFETQNSWSNLNGNERTKFFESLAEKLGLDITKYNNNLADTFIGKKIDFDYALGKKADVNATPTFFLNGEKLDPSDYGDAKKLKDTINIELKKASISLPK